MCGDCRGRRRETALAAGVDIIMALGLHILLLAKK
jgi:hypothetical protein